MTALIQTLTVARESSVARIAPSKTGDRLFQGAVWHGQLRVGDADAQQAF